MSIEASSILPIIRAACAPISLHEVAVALDCGMRDVTAGIAELVSDDAIVRVRNGDGIMRYALAGTDDDRESKASSAAASPEPPAAVSPIAVSSPANTAAAPAYGSKGSTLKQLVLRQLENNAGDHTAIELRSMIGGAWNSSQMTAALAALLHDGLAVKTGVNSSTRWRHVKHAGNAVPRAEIARPKPQRTASHALPRDFIAAAETDDKTRKALEFSARVADDAFEVYLASIVNPKIYGPLKLARDQAREALHAFNSRL